MSPIEARLEREAIGVVRRFRSGSYGPADVDITVKAAMQDLEGRCLSSGREDCIRAFRTALLATADTPS
jgi:hypothetical protein